MFEVMAELEAMCGRLAARRIQPERETRTTTVAFIVSGLFEAK